MILKKIVVGPFEANCYILGSAKTGEAIIIDPGGESEKIKAQVDNCSLKIKFIVNTHGHADHIGANADLGAAVYIHRLDVKFLTNPQLNLSSMLGLPLELSLPVNHLEDGQRLSVDTINLEVIHTPGHTPGGICLNAGEFIFTGDTLFAQGIGRTDIPGANEGDLFNSIRKRLMTLSNEVIIYPGHGPSSTIGNEKKGNPFI